MGISKYTGRVIGNANFRRERVRDVFSERDFLRREYEKLEGNYKNLASTIVKVEKGVKELQGVERELRMGMLLGGNPYLEGEVGERFVNDSDLLRLARNENKRANKAYGIIEKMERKHFKYVVEVVCADEKVARATAMVYRRGEILYCTPKFEKRFDSFFIERDLSEDWRLNINLEKGERGEFAVDDGRFIFVPDRKSSVSVAYFVPNRRNSVKIFEKVGEMVVDVVHGALKKDGVGKLGVVNG